MERQFETAINHNRTSLRIILFIATLAMVVLLILLLSITTLERSQWTSSKSAEDLAALFSTQDLIQLMGMENPYFSQTAENKKEISFSTFIFELATSLNPKDPRSLLGVELPGFSQFDGEIVVAGKGANYSNMPNESSPPIDFLIENRNTVTENDKQSSESTDTPKTENGKESDKEYATVDGDTEKGSKTAHSTGKKKVVYIYHTHSMESFLPLLKDVKDPNRAMDSKKNITLVGKKLGEELEQRGVGAIVNTTNFTQQVLDKEMEYWQSYDVSRPVVKQAMNQNKDIQLLFDLHRDSFGKKVTTVTINGEKYARTAFVIGAENPKYEQNLKTAKEITELLDKKYPGLNRMIAKKKGKGMDGNYNQDLSSQAILIEIGGYANNLDELYRTAEALADVISEYYYQAEAVFKQK
jgi:stage II sporulation protein P